MKLSLIYLHDVLILMNVLEKMIMTRYKIQVPRAALSVLLVAVVKERSVGTMMYFRTSWHKILGGPNDKVLNVKIQMDHIFVLV